MRVRLSRAINYYVFRGKKGHMISTRVYIEHRLTTQITIDWMFFILRGEMNHCRNSMLWDMGVYDEETTQDAVEQIAVGTPQKEASENETDPARSQKDHR